MGKREVEALTALDVRNAKPQDKPFKIRDGKGLFLEVRPSGFKVWRYRYRIAPDKPDQMYTVGEAGEGRGQMTLTEARNERARLRDLVRQGIHPRVARDESTARNVRAGDNTFAAVAEDWMAEARQHWSAHYFKQVRRGMDTDVIPVLGKRPMAAISTADIRPILKGRKKHATTAALLRLWIGSAFRWAIANGVEGVKDDPTIATRGMIKRPAVQHHKPLDRAELPEFLAAVRADTGNRQTAIAAELLLLTFVRPGELCGAAWSEINTAQALWIVPGARMKMGSDHYVPLTDRALELLAELHRLTGNREHLFPNQRDPKRPMDQGTLNRFFERIGYAPRITPHSMRATASTILNGLQFRPDVIERQLAHAPRDKVRASYNQAQYLPERKAMMDTWAALVLAPADSGNVIPIRATAAA